MTVSLALSLQACSTPRAKPSVAPLGDDPRQLLTVVTDGWNDFHAALQRYERGPQGGWQPVGEPIPAVIGEAGYAWGRGLHGEGAPPGRTGPVKREGDLRSPAGVFALGEAYGYAASRPTWEGSYSEATPSLRCVDDPDSRHYNRVVDLAAVEKDWQSAEHMRRQDDLYALAIVVRHNKKAPVPNAGSCIFLHVWAGPQTPVTGCTAMAREDLQTLARWLRPDHARVVALPRSEYEALREAWQLP